MAHSSLRTRILVMTALPAFLAALVIGDYTLVHRMVEVRADTAHRQQLIILGKDERGLRGGPCRRGVLSCRGYAGGEHGQRAQKREDPTEGTS